MGTKAYNTHTDTVAHIYLHLKQFTYSHTCEAVLKGISYTQHNTTHSLGGFLIGGRRKTERTTAATTTT